MTTFRCPKPIPPYDSDNPGRATLTANLTFTYPWLVVDTWGTDTPTGCWTQGGAEALAARLSLGWKPGRYKAVHADLSPSHD